MSAETHARRVGLAVALLLCAATARAQKPEARARTLMRDAMEVDYLATNMKAALTKLQSALKACDADKCSKETIAKIHANLGIVYAAGLDKNDEAIEQFKQALALDPNVVPDPNYQTDVVQKTFDAAKGASQSQAATTAPELAALSEQPVAEQVTGTPVPVYVELPEGVEAARVVLRYKASGQRRFKQLVLQKHGKGFGGYIPCAAVQQEGELNYFTTAFDANNERVAGGGSASEPHTVALKARIEGEPPALPDTEAPASCSKPTETPSCEKNEDCGAEQVCQNQQCVAGAPPSDEGKGAPKQNWIGVAFSPDLVLVQTTADACSPAAQEDGRLSCFYRDGTQYSNAVTVNPGELKGGIAFGSMRAMLFYERVIQKRMLIGVRLGFAFLGHPKRLDGETFFPLHAEARFAFFFAKDPFASKGIRPYAFVAAGAAETNARVGTVVTEPPGATGGNVPRNLDAYQKGGAFFGGLGAGLQYALNPKLALVGEASLRGYAPLSVFGISPVVGVAYGL